MNKLELDRCLQALAGAATQQQDASTQAGRLMRRLLLASQAQPNSALEDEANIALMARLRAAGAFQSKHRRSQRRWMPAWLSLPAAAGLLSLASVATLFVMLRPPALPFDDGLEIMRGAEQAQRLSVAHPLAFADELQALLQAHHLLVRRVEASGGPGAQTRSIQLQAKLPAGDLQLKQALQARGVSLPEHGRLFLVIEAMPARPD